MGCRILGDTRILAETGRPQRLQSKLGAETTQGSYVNMRMTIEELKENLEQISNDVQKRNSQNEVGIVKMTTSVLEKCSIEQTKSLR